MSSKTLEELWREHSRGTRFHIPTWDKGSWFVPAFLVTDGHYREIRGICHSMTSGCYMESFTAASDIGWQVYREVEKVKRAQYIVRVGDLAPEQTRYFYKDDAELQADYFGKFVLIIRRLEDVEFDE